VAVTTGPHTVAASHMMHPPSRGGLPELMQGAEAAVTHCGRQPLDPGMRLARARAENSEHSDHGRAAVEAVTGRSLLFAA